MAIFFISMIVMVGIIVFSFSLLQKTQRKDFDEHKK